MERKINLRKIWIRRVFLLWLTFISGFANILSMMTYSRVISHHTGNISQLAIAIVDGNWSNLLALLSLIICFLLGSIIAGFIYSGPNTRRKAHEVYTYLYGGCMLAALTLLNPTTSLLPICTCLLLGLQNGIQHKERDLLFRTTHLTGTLTDLGVLIGKHLRRHRLSLQTPLTLLLPLFSFTLGGILAAIAYSYFRYFSWYFLSITYWLAALFRLYTPMHETMAAYNLHRH